MNRGYNKNMVMCAVNAMYNYASIDDPAISDEIVETKSPLDILIEKEEEFLRAKKYFNLSSEAKQVIAMVFSAPSEIMELIASKKTHKIKKERIARMLERQWKDRRYVKKVIAELEDYALTLEG